MTRWNPFRELTRFDPFTEVESLFKDFPNRPLMRALEPEPTMKMDVSETDAAYTVKADIPGVKKEDIAVSIDGNMVSITAETRREKEEKEGEKVLRTERYYGSVGRTFTLGHDIDVAKASAAYDNGVLTLTLPKAPGAEARKLEVH
jgi:HSP20 family protein